MGMALSRKTGGIYSAGLVGEGFLARVFHRRDLLHFAFDPAVFQAGGEQIAGFDLFVCFSTVPSLTEVTL